MQELWEPTRLGQRFFAHPSHPFGLQGQGTSCQKLCRRPAWTWNCRKHGPGSNLNVTLFAYYICLYFYLLRHFKGAVLRAKPVKHLQKFSHRWIQFPLGSIRLYGLVGPDRDIFSIPPILAHVIPKISGTGWLGLPRWMEGTQEVLWSIKKCQHKSLLGGFHLPTCGSDFQWCRSRLHDLRLYR